MAATSSRQPKIIVLDDDPTGSQTVHSCLLLTRWDVETLRVGLADAAPIMFVLTNTRSLTPEDAAAVTREVCRNLKPALAAEEITDFVVVSRSDSTLRGHYPVETDVIAEELGGFDAHFLVPAFFEGGRFTKSSVHYLVVNGVPTPVHETEFAKDSVFGYSYSYLPDYVAEKTKGRIPADKVERFLLGDIRSGCRQRLARLQDNQCCVVDAENQADLNQFASDLLHVAATGKRFLFRSAASLLTALAKLPPQPIAAADMSKYMRSHRAGVAIVGSHVKKTTEQLEKLLEAPNTVPVEIEVSRLLVAPEQLAEQSELIKKEALAQIEQAHAAAKTAVVFTSRKELEFADITTRLAFGQSVSALLMAIVQELPTDIGFLISKGGITSNDVVSTGLNLPTARLLGQILAGCSVVKTPADHPRFPDLPVVLFPGNVGDAHALATVYSRLAIGIEAA
ncbi:MAG: four-carbon acid sugar kinase family protein [Pseudanabaenaceae cyanobacterium bins.39]|nr:four-carbon acid sugar kinase family protein [Pseudanabaenaceae cyanobacterium bins.39]